MCCNSWQPQIFPRRNVSAAARKLAAGKLKTSAIIIILVVAILIFLIDISLDRLFGHVQLQTDWSSYWRLAWKTNGVLQIHRLAHEEMGFGHWTRCLHDVPVTDLDTKLACLSIDDPNHPTLQKQRVQPTSNVAGTAIPDPEKETGASASGKPTPKSPLFTIF